VTIFPDAQTNYTVQEHGIVTITSPSYSDARSLIVNSNVHSLAFDPTPGSIHHDGMADTSGLPLVSPESSVDANSDAGKMLADFVATGSSVDGTIKFADANHTGTPTASLVSEGSGYIGSFLLNGPSENNGNVSVGFKFSLGHDQMNLSPGTALTQSYAVTVGDPQHLDANVTQTISVSLGGPGNDNFVFHPGIGADTIINFNPQLDTIELDHFTQAQTVGELASLITTDAHGDAVIALGHDDGITLPGMTALQLHAMLQSFVHLH